MATIARKSAAPAAAQGQIRRRIRHYRRRQRRCRAGDGAVQPLARQQGAGAGKGGQLGGTTRKAAFWYWVPNNAADAGGRHQGSEEGLHSLHGAPVAARKCTIPTHPRFGMPEWEYSQYEAIYDNASTATELLSKKGALEYRHCDFVPDYWAELPEDKAPKGRVLLPKGARETHVRRRRGGDPAPCRRRPSATASTSAPAIACSASILNGNGRGHRRRGRHGQGQEALLRAQGRRLLHRRLHP